MEHQLHPNPDSELKLSVTPASAGWRYLSFSALTLSSGNVRTHATRNTEVAIVPLSGEGTVTVGSVGSQSFTLKRENVFTGKPDVLYIPPGHEIKVEATSDFEFALGGAPVQTRGNEIGNARRRLSAAAGQSYSGGAASRRTVDPFRGICSGRNLERLAPTLSRRI
jgi:5-deoxy-D-glucuronate isomerase